MSGDVHTSELGIQTPQIIEGPNQIVHSDTKENSSSVESITKERLAELANKARLDYLTRIAYPLIGDKALSLALSQEEIDIIKKANTTAKTREEIYKDFQAWNEGDYRKLISYGFDNYSPPEELSEVEAAAEKKRLTEYGKNLVHDINVATTPISVALQDVFPEYEIALENVAMIKFPAKVIRRFQRQFEGVKIQEPIDLEHIGEDLKEFFSKYPTFQEKKVKINYQYNDSRTNKNNNVLVGDPDGVEFGAFNIMRNAQKREINDETNPGENIDLTINRTDAEDNITIQDDAGGFNPQEDLLKQAIDQDGQVLPYQNAFVRGRTGKDRFRGQGLGLSIAKEVFVDELGGSIKATNVLQVGADGLPITDNPNIRQGARFSISIPHNQRP